MYSDYTTYVKFKVVDMDIESLCSSLIAIQVKRIHFEQIITYRDLRIRIPILKGLESWKIGPSRCKNCLRTRVQHIRLRPKNWRNSFMVQTPHWRACRMPIISITLRHTGVPIPPNELAVFSVASCKMLARSSSEYFPLGPRIRLDFK